MDARSLAFAGGVEGAAVESRYVGTGDYGGGSDIKRTIDAAIG